MYEIIKLELYKLKKSKMFWGIMIYIILMIPAMLSMAEEGTELQHWNIDQFFGLINSKTMFILPFFISNFYSAVIPIDNNAYYFRDLMAFGYKREQVLFGKVIPTACVSALFSLLFMISMIVPLILKNCPSEFNSEILPRTIIFVLIMLFYYFSIAFITDCLVMLIPSPLFIIGMALFENLIIQMPPALGADISSLKWTIFYLTLDLSAFNIDLTIILKIIIGCSIHLLLVGYISYVTFKKREFK